MTLEQQVHENDVKLRKLTDKVNSLERQINELTVAVIKNNINSKFCNCTTLTQPPNVVGNQIFCGNCGKQMIIAHEPNNSNF